MFKEIEHCRICGNTDLISVLDLGKQYLTGVFPKETSQKITNGPLEIVRCFGDTNSCCGLVQLKHSYDLDEMYGNNYGYRSSLNNSMVDHLYKKVRDILKIVTVKKGDLIIDIGSNDGTLLSAYGDHGYILVGVDPSGSKFKEYYPNNVNLLPDFFSKDLINTHFENKKAKIITSIAMFYDLESPVDFAQQVSDILSDDGVWILEQSYLPTMIEQNAYDTICHEHLEYYSLRQMKWIADRVGLKIIDVEENYINGGSFSIKLAKEGAPYIEKKTNISKFNHRETFLVEETYHQFRDRVFEHREKLIDFIESKNKNKQLVLGYGASTKGNVVLQFCSFTKNDIPYIAEVNKDKFGSFTPGTNIPIISEKEAKEMKPDYFMVLPWHFKDNIISKEHEFLKSGGKLLFPLPSIEEI